MFTLNFLKIFYGLFVPLLKQITFHQLKWLQLWFHTLADALPALYAKAHGRQLTPDESLFLERWKHVSRSCRILLHVHDPTNQLDSVEEVYVKMRFDVPARQPN